MAAPVVTSAPTGPTAEELHDRNVRALANALTTQQAKALFGPKHTTLTALQNTRRPAGHLALAPTRHISPFENAMVCALDAIDELDEELKESQKAAEKQSRELKRAFIAAAEKAEQQREAERRSVAQIAKRTSNAVFKRWDRVSNTLKDQMKGCFEVYRVRSIKSKQDDMLQDTEALTAKLIECVRSKAANRDDDDDGEGGRASTKRTRDGKNSKGRSKDCGWDSKPFDMQLLDSGKAGAFEGQLRLLNTLGGTRNLREYQRTGLRWLINLYDNNLNGILADEMGLGKTVQTIALLAYFAEYKQDWGPHVIVVPTTVVLNWEMELKRWLPGFKVITYTGNMKERKRLREGWTKDGHFNVVITSYGTVLRDQAVFRRRSWGFLVLDEAHTIKNWASQKWLALFDFRAEHRLLLTGTPLQNSVMELWSLFHFLLPDLSAFESNDQFREWFADPVNTMVAGNASVDEALIARIHTLFRPFLLRRLKKHVECELPGKSHRVVLCGMSRRQKGLYQGLMLLNRTAKSASPLAADLKGAFSALLNLRKVCNHPDVYAERPIVSPFDMHGCEEIQFRFPAQALLFNNTGSSYSDPCASRRSSFALCDLQDNDMLRFVCNRGVALDDVLCADTSFDFFSLQRALELGAEARTAWEQSLKDSSRAKTKKTNKNGGGTDSSTTMFWEGIANAHRVAREEAALKRSAETLAQQTFRATLRDDALIGFFLRTTAVRTIWGSLKQNRFCSPTTESAVIRSLVPSIPGRARALQPIVDKFAVVVDRVRAIRGPTLRVMHGVHDPTPFQKHSRETLAGLLNLGRQQPTNAKRFSTFSASHFLREFWPLHSRRGYLFPDKRAVIHDAGKLQVLGPLLQKLIFEGHRALIFTQFNGMLDVLERFLALQGTPYLRLDGSTKAETRQQLVERFNGDPAYPVMILSTRSGGIGINLVGADTVIFYDSDWNPTIDLQAQDRVHRIGQTRAVTIYRLVTEGTVEEKILQASMDRKKLNNVIIRAGRFDQDVSTIAAAEAEAAKASPVPEAEDDGEDGEAPAALRQMSVKPGDILRHLDDQDEDYDPTALAGTQDGDVDAAMREAEDAEDRDAQQALAAEMQQQVDEEALMGESAAQGGGSGGVDLDEDEDDSGEAGGEFEAEWLAIKRKKMEVTARFDRLGRHMFAAYKQSHGADVRHMYNRLREKHGELEVFPTAKQCL